MKRIFLAAAIAFAPINVHAQSPTFGATLLQPRPNGSGGVTIDSITAYTNSSLLATANTWSAKQTFSGGFGTPTITSGQCLQSGGTGLVVGTTCAGGTTPGGSSGQIQYNNAGAFGGFTASGDCTITPSTGAVVCTKSNGTTFGTAAFANLGTSGATLGLLSTANTWAGAQTFATSNIGVATGTSLAVTGALTTGGNSVLTNITAGATPTSGFTSGHLVSSVGSVVSDSGLIVSNVVTGTTGAQDTALGYWTSTAIGATSIPNCTGALTYSTTSHTWGCNSGAGTGTVTTTGSPTTNQIAVFSGSSSITGFTRAAPNHCTIISTSATTCNNGGSVSANNGTYTPSAGILYFKIRMAGGGGGASGSGTSPGTGGDGVVTTFNTSTTAPAGLHSPPTGASGGAGGAAGANCDFTIAGQGGSPTDQSISEPPSGNGGSSFFGGGGIGASTVSTAAGNGAANSGSGGGGAGAVSSINGTGGGGAGAYCEKVFASPTGTYPYTVGTGGAAGTAGSGGGVGGAGANGNITIDEYYN